ncbi:sensor domain-containing protein [Halomicroarcula sp. GCM10025709]|uniref:sensor domain-containing protein n=1 Tax=Haloarcula TaxID=2237 RepID=UPI0024C35C3F|nr:sensor domain-containing protein [Halomicroarcula sp. YJ-61-S]
MIARPLSATLGQFVRVPFEGATYRRLVYLLLAGPLGLAYFVGTTTGVSTGLGLSVTLIGLPILGLTLLAVTGAAWLEAQLSRVLLDQETATPTALSTLHDAIDDPDTGVVGACTAFLVDATAWTSLAVVLLKSVFGLVAFVAVVTAGSVVGSLLVAPLVYDAPGMAYQTGSYTVTTLSGALGLAGLGVVLGLVSLHVLNALADLGGYLTDALLSIERGEPAE